MDLDEISIELSSNLSHEQTPVGGASSVPQDESRGLNEMTPEDLGSITAYVQNMATNLEISIDSIEPLSNLSHEQTPVAGASSVPQDESSGLNKMTPEDPNSLKKQVYEYAHKNWWNEAEPIFNKYPHMVRIPLTDNEDRALHVAVKANSITFVKGLVNLMTPQDLQIPDLHGYTAFFLAAESGKSDLVQIMIEKNKILPLIKIRKRFPSISLPSHRALPVHRAVIGGHHKIVQDLSSKTLLQEMNIKDIEELFFQTIEYDMFDVATKLFEEYGDVLAIRRRSGIFGTKGQTALEMLLRKPSKEKLSTQWGNNIKVSTRTSRQLLRLLKKIWDQLETQLAPTEILELIDTSSLVSAMAYALQSGNVQAVSCFLFENRVLSLLVNSNEQNILHYAVQQRHSFVSYIFKMKPPHDILLAVDKDGNNILHFAAYPLENETSSHLRATAKMKTEVTWFKEQEKSFPPKLRTMRNNEGKTPKDIFLDKHKDLSREVKDTAKGIADSGMLVAALVATVAFAAALTVPGGNTGPWFTVFILANAAALFTSSASILSFLSNFTSSRFADGEFVIALHPSLIVGYMLLLISVVTMVISFAAASFLIFEHTSKWAAYVVASMGVFPLLLFLLFQFSIFDNFLWFGFYRMSFAQ